MRQCRYVRSSRIQLILARYGVSSSQFSLLFPMLLIRRTSSGITALELSTRGFAHLTAYLSRRRMVKLAGFILKNTYYCTNVSRAANATRRLNCHRAVHSCARTLMRKYTKDDGTIE